MIADKNGIGLKFMDIKVPIYFNSLHITEMLPIKQPLRIL